MTKGGEEDHREMDDQDQEHGDRVQEGGSLGGG